MTSLKASVLAALLLIPPTSLGQGPSEAQTPSAYSMDSHTFTLALPSDYKLGDESSTIPGYKGFAFATAVRSDGTRGVMQVSLFDIGKMSGKNSVALDEFADKMVTTMRRTHGEWKSCESSSELIGVQTRRVEWSGSAERAPNDRVGLRGVMIIGIKDDVGFRLEVMDTDSRAALNLPRGERALKTFALTVKR